MLGTPTQDESRRIYCLIEGDYNVFPVDVKHNWDVCDLQEAIQKKRKDSILMNVDPFTLEVWKVSTLLMTYNLKCHWLTPTP
jgi:hypothetical protein